MDTSKIRDAYVAIHGHFYQPPRENPWLEEIETEESAYPFHDWNERITFECYRPNAYARILDEKNRILDIINNYSFISFNFGPTLLSWIEEKNPVLYQKIIEADREGHRCFGHGNAISQVYHHIIMPLANERDRETEVIWGIADFERHFRRKPEGIWLPETAVNYPTIKLLIKYGLRFIILSPFQALRMRPFGGKRWIDVSNGRIDPTQPYRYFLKDSSGKKVIDQYIDIFFYDGAISKEVAFGDLLRDGNLLCDRFLKAYQTTSKRPQLIHIATDGETYGHHKKFGEMALAFALRKGFSMRGLKIINLGAFLNKFPPVYEVDIDEGPKGEGSSWSCSHGVGRWKEDCGCSTGGQPGWNQRWREPLREALNSLRDELGSLFEIEGERIFKDVWEARNGYIDLIHDRSSGNVERFFDRYGVAGIGERERIRGLKLLEMQRHTLQMFTSCGWFFADPSGLETRIILLNAARAIELAEELTGRSIEEKFLLDLSKVKSNISEMGDGSNIYLRFVKPRCLKLENVINHFAISSLFEDGEKSKRIFSFFVENIRYEKIVDDGKMLLLGHVRVGSKTIQEKKEFLFGLIPSKKDIFRTWVREFRDEDIFRRLRERGLGGFESDEQGMVEILNDILGSHSFTIRDVLNEGKGEIFKKIIKKEMDEYYRINAEIYERTKETVELIVKEGLEVPQEIRFAAELTLSNRLLNEIKDLEKNQRDVIDRGEVERIIDEAKRNGYRLRMEDSSKILSDILTQRMTVLWKSRDSSLAEKERDIEELINLLDKIEKWGFLISREISQDFMYDILAHSLIGLEECLWREGKITPFPPNLISLAEKLGFNIDKYYKIVSCL